MLNVLNPVEIFKALFSFWLASIILFFIVTLKRSDWNADCISTNEFLDYSILDLTKTLLIDRYPHLWRTYYGQTLFTFLARRRDGQQITNKISLRISNTILVINCVILEKNSNNLGLLIWIYVYVFIQSYSLSEIGIDIYKNDRGHSVFFHYDCFQLSSGKLGLSLYTPYWFWNNNIYYSLVNYKFKK